MARGSRIVGPARSARSKVVWTRSSRFGFVPGDRPGRGQQHRPVVVQRGDPLRVLRHRPAICGTRLEPVPPGRALP